MIKYYRILQTSGVIYFVKTKGKHGNTIEISCHQENPYEIRQTEHSYYEIINDKLINCSTLGMVYKNHIVSFQEISKEKFFDVLFKFLCKI